MEAPRATLDPLQTVSRRDLLGNWQQRWVVSTLAGTVVTFLGRPLSDRLLGDVSPERRGVVDDLKEALLKASLTVATTVIVSMVVRRLVASR